MSRKRGVQELITEAIEDKVRALGVDLIDVVFAREGEKRILRLLIDKRGGVHIDDCVAVSEMADPIISETLGIKEHDLFEVSSAGLDRPLKALSDLVRHEGAEVDLKLYKAIDGVKVFSGRLGAADEASVTIMTDAGEKTFARKDVASVKRTISFDR